MNQAGEIVGSAYQAHAQYYPQPGWVEQDPRRTVGNARELINQVMRQSGG